MYNLKYMLSELRKPIVFDIAVYSDFEELTKDHYVLHPPSKTDNYLGMHALAIVVFTEKTFVICNSYG